jgi:hypothetical protein
LAVGEVLLRRHGWSDEAAQLAAVFDAVEGRLVSPETYDELGSSSGS